ncbi:BTB domain-containing protein [Phanerochaete sordida]|uniref:BTB domain-containing protein n=1 Tax=Phanerochaete sordida TaxID=48140 RepID=A0A9P3GJR2_9APHY|nr:BTB domain-containing protein [Phanerochaete sordida]
MAAEAYGGNKTLVPRFEAVSRWDGDIALATPASSDATIAVFKVHRGVLAYHSKVFADMLALPVDAAHNETYEDVPLVCLHDNEDDLCKLIKAMYDLSSLRLQRFDADTPLQVRGVLTLAVKYEVESVREYIVSHIEADWPRTFEELCRWRLDFLHTMEVRTLHNQDITLRAEHIYPEPASAIRLAFDFGITSILPAAFYRLSLASVKSVWKENPPGWTWNPDWFSARWDLLTGSDYRRLMNGKDALRRAQKELPWVWHDGNADCEPECMEGKQDLHDSHHPAFPQSDNDVFFELLRMSKDLRECNTASLCNLCPECREAIKQNITALLDEMWTSLPRIFLLDQEL